MDRIDALRERWPLPQAVTLREATLARWAEGHRAYHDLRHLSEVLAALDLLAEAGADVLQVRLAAWFHDAVYDVHAVDNEQQSAALAEQELASIVDATVVGEVARLVRITASHECGEADVNAPVLCDADLSILGSDPGRYAEYASDVRQEYAHVADSDFASARISILQGFLGRTTIYSTKVARDWWERPARANIGVEIEGLQG
ncbi:MAG: HD domain-containing protein [Nocardioidaceae bacterium]